MILTERHASGLEIRRWKMAYTEKSISAVGSRGNHKFALNFYENSYDTSNNTSNCSFDLVLSPMKSGYDWYYSNSVPVKVSVNINGNSYSANVMSYDGRSTVVVLSGSNISLTHNDDGTLNASISFYEDTLLSASYLPGDCGASASVQLTDIPRKAILTSADNFTDEDNPTIYYDCKAKDIISSLVACISFDGVDEGIRYRPVSKNESSYTFQFSEEEITLLRNQCPIGSSTKEMTFFLRSTINGEYFYSSLVKTFSVVNGQPTVDAYAIETDQNKIALTGRSSKIIRGYNNVNAYMFVTPKKGAEIIQNSISNDGKAVNVTDTYFRNTKSNIFQFYTEDSRGNVINKQVTLDMVDYFPPSCIMEVTPPTTDGRMTITAKGNFFNGSFGSRTNSLTVRYRYKTNNDSWTGWYTMSATKSGNTYSASYTVTGLNYRNRYTVQVQAEDLLDIANSDEKSVRSIPLFDWGEHDFRFHIPVSFQGNSLIDLLYPIGSIYMSVNSTDPQTLFGGTWERWGNGRVPVGLDAQQNEFRNAEQTGGEKVHWLTTSELPSHSHGIQFPNSADGSNEIMVPATDGTSRRTFESYSWAPTRETGEGSAHNNLQPYIVCYMWKRIA